MSSESPPSGRARWALFLLLLAYMLSFIDRNVMAILVGPIREDFDISDTQYGLLHGLAFTIFYTFLGLPIGRLADRKSRRTIVGVGVLFWSVMTSACGLASSFAGLFITRMGVGLGEAALSPPAHSMLSDLFEPERLPRVMSIFTLGITIGGGMAYMIGGWVYEAMAGVNVVLPLVGELRAWQLTFLLIGLPGFLVGALMWTIQEPARKGVSLHRDPGVTLVELLEHLRRHARVYTALFGSIALLSMLGYGTMTWYVEMLLRRFGSDRALIGRQFGLIFIFAGSAGALSGGWLAGWLGRRRADANLLLVLMAALLAFFPGVAGPLMPTETGALWMSAPILFLMNSFFGVAIAALQLVTPNEMRAQVSAVMLFFSNLLGLGIGPVAVGALTDHVFGGEGSLHLALAAFTAVVAPAAALFAAQGLRPYGALVESLKRGSGNALTPSASLK